MNNDRALRLGTGRLLLPAASHRSGEGYFDSRAEAMYFYSDDDGRSWRPSPGKIALPYSAHSFSGLQEPGAVELSNGVIWSWARTDLGRQFEMFSLDGGGTWTSLPAETVVSLNMWGFTKSILEEIRDGFPAFLDEGLKNNPMKCEYFLPAVVSRLTSEDRASVAVLKSHDKWYGITYKEDKPMVVQAIQKMKEEGIYPQHLWE